MRGAAFFACANNYLIDVKFGIIMDVEASRAIRQAEVGASQTMIERTEACFGIKPEWLAADTAYGSAPNLDWLVNEQGIAPHVPVIDKSQREDGTFSREDFVFVNQIRDTYLMPGGQDPGHSWPCRRRSRSGISAPVPGASRACPLKAECCPNVPVRQIKRDVNEAARAIPPARWPKRKPSRNRAVITQEGRDAVRASQAHPAA